MVPTTATGPVNRLARLLSHLSDTEIDEIKEDLAQLLLAKTKPLWQPGQNDPARPCWRWLGAALQQEPQSHPKVRVGGKAGAMVTISRLAFWVYRGESQRFELWDGRYRIVQRCGDRWCCNPWHGRKQAIRKPRPAMLRAA